MFKSWLNKEKSDADTDRTTKSAVLTKKKPLLKIEKVHKVPRIMSEGMKRWVEEVKEVQRSEGPMTYQQALVRASCRRRGIVEENAVVCCEEDTPSQICHTPTKPPSFIPGRFLW